MSNVGNIVGGHKANINNPHTSDEAKQHSQQVLDEQYDGGNVSKDGPKNPNNVAGGLKATLNNPNVSQAAKESAEERLAQT